MEKRMRSSTEGTPTTRGVKGWTLVTQEMDPGQDSPHPTYVTVKPGITVSGPAPVKQHPRHPVVLSDVTVPARVHAMWTRHTDGLVAEMVVNTANDGRGPLVEWFKIRPARDVRGSTDDYRLPIPTMTKLAVTEWGYSPGKGIDIDERRLRHERNKKKQLDKLAVVARSGDAAKAKRVPMVPAVKYALAHAGYPPPAKGFWSDAYIYKLRSQARALGLTQDTKESK